MNKDVIILPHHLDVVISMYYFSDKWDKQLGSIKEYHGPRMVDHTKKAVNDFFDSAEAKVVIERPDSVCSPGLSKVCEKCMVSYCIDGYPAMMDLHKDEVNYKKYQLERIGKDEGYRKFVHIRLTLSEVTALFYYGLEPKNYSTNFLVSKIKETAKKLGKCSSSVCRPSQVGYSRDKNIAENFPYVHKLMESGLFEDFVGRMINECITKEKITSRELNGLKKKYCNLFAAVGSDKFYYEVLNMTK